uniref:Ribonuclease E n=1 Tax=Platysiphonia delicata TaxID=2006979 RepID=A0A1Z1M0U2_9FLOR|nr:ribonuclease E [Platysiphonia delicata]ARW59510.1 ribonuclease E [Platysiphonia delicata]
MVKKIIISSFNNVAAVFNHNRIEEIVVINSAYQVNDIYIGTVQKIFSSINAAFIKLGRYGKSGFIHISDTKYLRKNRQTSNVQDILTINQLILVQVVKEPTFNKGPRLTTNIHLHGKYLTLMPFCNIISISQKIHDDSERIYLYSLATLLKPDMMGLLVKYSAQGVDEKVILKDLDSLKKQWYFIKKAVITTSYPSLIYKDEDLVKKIIRDFHDEAVKKIIVDSQDGLQRLYYYLNKCSIFYPVNNVKLQLYCKSDCILEQFHIKKAINNSLKSKVKLLLGGYIVIENYEALTIIDVNSGSFNSSDNTKDTILRTNFYAAIEIAYQLKIRNINGIIIIDFIDMYSQKDQLQLLEHLNSLLKHDNAKPQIVQLSELGFVELTRRRRGQSLKEIFSNINLKYSKSYFNNHLAYNYFCSINQNDLSKRCVQNKSINSLFFQKKFKRNILLERKLFLVNKTFYHKYFTFLDELLPIYLFNPKANYFVPFVLYSNFFT